jgi:hypothetical protein
MSKPSNAATLVLIVLPEVPALHPLGNSAGWSYSFLRSCHPAIGRAKSPRGLGFGQGVVLSYDVVALTQNFKNQEKLSD